MCLCETVLKLHVVIKKTPICFSVADPKACCSWQLDICVIMVEWRLHSIMHRLALLNPEQSPFGLLM